eukprot:TRINITY_DN7993_c0_g1_i2.p1 TRINITY_DN7993_c0_g1~~TRINITY_DN7993_c0_g1_i2.p1  ORF type:complete len:616 (+),score=100.26 TRINITY_DN7993_c0_g1_i2:86-1933(+)
MQLLVVFLLFLEKVAEANSDNGEKDFAALKEELVDKYDDDNGWYASNFSASLGHPINESIVQQSLEYVANVEDVQRRRRLAELSASLRPLFVALPKDTDGMLSYQTSRYAVHRFMMQERGWYIRGLESSIAESGETNGIDSEWVAAYLHGQILQRTGSMGTSLSDLALFVAALEHLIYFDASNRLRAVYEYLGFAVEKPQAKTDILCVMDAFMFYMVSFDNLAQEADKDPFTIPGNYSPAMRRDELCDGSLVDQISTEPVLKDWRHAIEDTVGDEADDKLSFSQATRFANKFLDNYHVIQQADCRALKKHLVSAEESSGNHKAGSLDLTSYHKLDQFGDYQFQESEEHLRRAGILDETSKTPYLVLANYVGSRINCVESSGMFAICCQNECDAVLAQLEVQLEASAASASEIVAILTKLSSISSFAPLEPSSDLLDRLSFLERAHHGVVPIHSEGFAMWMHNVYPRECPQAQPHRSSTFPMTAGEWLHEEGESWVEESITQAGVSESHVDDVKKIMLLTMAISLLILAVALESPSFYTLRVKLGINDISATRRCCLFLSALNIFAAFTDSLPLGQIITMFIAAWIVRSLLYRLRIRAATDAKVECGFHDKLQKAI